MSKTRLALASLALLGVLELAFFWRERASQIAIGGNDFLSFYAGGRLAGSPYLYSPERFIEVQRQTSGFHGGGVLSFSRPPFYAAVMWPLAQLPYPAAYAIWQALCLAALVAFVFLWPEAQERPLVALACCWSLPVSASFANGQDSIFLLLWIVLALRNLDRRPGLAGLLAALCAAKFHLFLLLPVLVIARKQWRFGAGLLTGAVALTTVSFAVAGPGWVSPFAALITSARLNPIPHVMPNLHGLTRALPHADWIEVALSLCVAAAVWAIARHSAVEIGWAAVLVGGLLVSRHAYVQDCVLLLPACLILARPRESTPVRYLALFLLFPLIYIPNAAPHASAFAALLPTSLLLLLVAMMAYPGNAPKTGATGNRLTAA